MSSIHENVPVHDANPSLKPSDVVEPTRVSEAPQQASTQPGSGSEVRDPQAQAADGPRVVEVPGEPVPWKDSVIAYAKKTRGTVLRKSSLKEHGDKILAGVAPARDPTRKQTQD
ncbi:hypothetical protein FA95DRAFT_1568191 [Auriscalpium vulgare]|uniref:Uncharacterized protein n=1 Tax=Auriscalpium vulgare TaxID=40419 RepID=A0ACB8R063_9AGAM|nr:hypothetical protein FA95DRAFT_1568191 [Auriscalpium vulgare]